MSKTKKVSLIPRIESDLLSGHFRPGEWLKQGEIEENYAANRFDVRMALMDLKARQLIEHIPNRGFRVINLSEREREELFETRIILETAAIRLAIARISDQTLAELDAIVAEFNNRMTTAEVGDLRKLNGRFHDTLYQTSGNRLLVEEIKALRQRGLPGMRSDGLAWRTMAGIQQSNDDHLRMIALLREGDEDGLADAVAVHLSNWRQYLPTGD